MADIVLKDGSGVDQTYPDVETVMLTDTGGDKTQWMPKINLGERAVTITENGVQEITPIAGDGAMTKVTVTTNVAGGSGGETQEKTVQLAMADGDQVITPDIGKTLSSVTVEKPETLVPGNIKKDVVIGGVTGALDPNEGYNNVVDALWGPDQTLATIYGLGEALDTAHFPGIKISAWATVKSTDWHNYLDESYPWYLQNIEKIANTDLLAKLNTFATSVMNATGNNAFSKIFEGADKAAFMDGSYVTDIPTVENTDARTWSGFVQMLWRSINSTLRNMLTGPGQDWGNVNANPTDGEIMHLPFIWYPVVASGGQTLSDYTLQNPTGEMPTYEEGLRDYTGTGAVVVYMNAIPDVGITNQVIMVMEVMAGQGAILYWYSYGAQTIPEATMGELTDGLWKAGFGDVTLTAGWNLSSVTTEEGLTQNNVSVEGVQTYVNLVSAQAGPLLKSLPFDQMSDYEKSIFKPLYSQAYKRKNNKSITLDFTLRYHVETPTT